jgi:hypothetical protein
MKVQIGDLVVHVDTMEELDQVVQRYGKGRSQPSASPVGGNGSATEGAVQLIAPVVSEPRAPGTPKTPTFTNGALIKSSSKRDAMAKLYRNLKASSHRDFLKFLATKGSEGADNDEIREAFGMAPNAKLGGFTSAIRRSAPHYGLEGDDVMIVDFKGIVGATRIQIYKIGTEMLEMMKERGLLDSGVDSAAGGAK